MPLFSYACRGCGKEFETLVRGSEAPVCESCGGSDLDKLSSAFAPMTGSARREPVGCGAQACCQMQGGCCPN